MRGKIVKSSVTCKINWAASKNLQIFFYFPSAKVWKQPTKPRIIYEFLWINLNDITPADII